MDLGSALPVFWYRIVIDNPHRLVYNIKMKIDYDTVYHFDFTNRVKFGGLDEETINELLQDGRVASKFLERYVPLWFPELKFVDATGYDHVDVATGKRRWDLKGFTKRGANYVPSNMLGAGRSINLQEAHDHANAIDYIFSDVVDFPKVKIRFKSGKDLVKEFPRGKIDFKYRQQLFDAEKIESEKTNTQV